MKSILPAFTVVFAAIFAQAECPKMVKGMEAEPELSRIEAATDFSTCSAEELNQVEARMAKQVNLFCPAGLKSLTALTASQGEKNLSSENVLLMLTCSSRKATLALIRAQRTK